MAACFWGSAVGYFRRLGPTMRCSRRRGSPSPFRAFAAGAADLVSLGQSLPACVHGVAWLCWLAFSPSENQHEVSCETLQGESIMPERHSANPIMCTSSLGHGRMPLRVLEYWRTSLADAERQAVDEQKLRAALAIPTQMLRRGQITDRALVDASFRAHAEALGEPAGTNRVDATAQPAQSPSATDQEASCPVLLCVVRASLRTKSGKRTQAPLRYIAPLWIPAILSRSGRLAQPESAAPWISRDLLEPVQRGRNEMVLGSTESLDEFLSNNEVPETGEDWTAYWAYANAMLSHVARDAGWSYADVSVDNAAKNETVGRGFDLVAAGLDPKRFVPDRSWLICARRHSPPRGEHAYFEALR